VYVLLVVFVQCLANGSALSNLPTGACLVSTKRKKKKEEKSFTPPSTGWFSGLD